jgi:hypothetical protein
MEIESADIDAWNTAKGQVDGKPSLIRFRPYLRKHLGDPRYPRRLVITWTFEELNASGMPNTEQSDAMRGFEDKIIAALDPDRLAILAFIFTNSGTREWHFYTGNIEEVGKQINDALVNEAVLPINLQVEDDPEWHELGQVLNQCK